MTFVRKKNIIKFRLKIRNTVLSRIICLFSIGAHRGRGGGDTSCTPSEDFEKLDHKNAIKHENRVPHPRFSHNPKYPLKKN
jgi:hypothetical protein